MRISQGAGLSEQKCRELCLEHYPELAEVVLKDKTLLLQVEEITPEDFERSPASGKLISVLDKRKR